MLGVIATSDKTPLTVGTGSKEMHPFLLSLTNIKAGVRMKATSHAFSLTSYLPIPKFKNVTAPVQAALSACVFHISVGIITESLQKAAIHGHVMPGPDGDLRICHTVLASYISDLPEQHMIACVTQNQSPTSLATQDEFGDGLQRPPRRREHLEALILQALSRASPDNLPAYIRVTAALGITAVHRPFWFTWCFADSCEFLTVDVLHAWHKMFFNHVVKWIINIMGGDELDRRLSALQRCVGVRHWTHGVSKLKQCTGREHHDLQKIIVPVIAGAVPDQVVRVVRALMEFFFQGQSLRFYEEQLHGLDEALREFHHFKNTIIIHGRRLSKRGHILHFCIPKLEGMGRVVWSTEELGAPFGYSSDSTERCHITHVKTPFRATNKRGDYAAQCARFMDRVEKTRNFQLFTSLTYHRCSLINFMVDEASAVADHYPEATWLSHALPSGEYRVKGAAAKKSLFDKPRNKISDNFEIAFSVTIQPHYPRKTTVEAAVLFMLEDFHPSLGDYFILKLSHDQRNGRRRSTSAYELPFTALNIWCSFRMQQHSNTVLVRGATDGGLSDSSESGICESLK